MTPALSKKQFAFMRGIQSGSIKRAGLSPTKAAEFTSGVDYSSLPERANKAARSRAADKLRGARGKPRRRFGVRPFRTATY